MAFYSLIVPCGLGGAPGGAPPGPEPVPASSALSIPWALAGSSGSGSGSGGLGSAGIKIALPPTQGDSMPFAKAVATFDYSRRLANIRYEEQGDIVEYKFSDGPLKPGYQPFGRQPVQ